MSTKILRVAVEAFVIVMIAVRAQDSAAGAPPSSVVVMRESTVELDLGGKRVPKWGGGALLVLEGDKTALPTFTSFDRNGRRSSTVAFKIPGAERVYVLDFARGADGTVAVCGSAADNAGRVSSFVGWVSPAGYDAQVVHTSPYIPMSVTVAPDRTIWTAGTEDRIPRPKAATTLRDVLKPEAAVFRRFDGSGKMIAGFVPQSEIQIPISLWPNSGVFGSAGSRIFWYSSKEGSAIELSLNGVVTRFSGLSLTDGETERGGLALTEDGNVFVSSIGRSGWSISTLDRVRRAWVQVGSLLHWSKIAR